MPPALTFGADLDPILGDLVEIWFGPQDLEPSFTWDGPDDWLSEEAVEIEEEEREGNLPESPGRTNEVPPPRDTSLPQGALKPLDGLSPELILAPVDAEGHLESLLDEAPQRATWHKSQGSARAFEGMEPLGEVPLGYPLDLLDSYFEAPVEGEPEIVALEARRPIFDEGARARLDPSPGPGAAANDLDAYTRASVLLEGEQNSVLPCVGCEQYAAPCAPQPFSFSPSSLLPPSLDTRARGIAPGERATSVQRAADPRLEALKPPNQTPPEEPGGAGLGCIHAAGKAGAKAVERAVVDAHEAGEAPSDANAAPAPTEGTASVEPASGAVEATTARPEALEPKAVSAVWRGLEQPPPPPPREGSGEPGSPPREAPNEGMRKRGLEAPPPLPPESPSEGKCGPQRAPRNTPRAGVLALQASASTALKGATPGLPKQGPPWDIEGEPGGTKAFEPKRPFEAENEGDAAGHTGHHENEPCRIQSPSASSAPQISNHLPRARTRHRGATLKPPEIDVLRPIERARDWKRRGWQRGHTPTSTCHARVTRATRATQRLARRPHPKPCTFE